MDRAHLAFAALFHGASPRADRNDYGVALGGRLLLLGSAHHATGPFLFGVAATAEHSTERTEYTLVSGGLVLGLDASLGDFRFGVLVEGGAAHLELPSAPSDGPGPFGPKYTASHTDFGEWLPYAQASLFAQWARPGSIHPYVSPTATWLIDRGSRFPTPMAKEGSPPVTCRTCGARFDAEAWSMLALVERIEPDDVKRILLDWSSEHCIEIRRCGQCAREVPAKGEGQRNLTVPA